MVQQDIVLGRLIKSLEEITVHSDFSSHDHEVELGEKNGNFFVNLDGAVIFVSNNGEEALEMFYSQVGKIQKDEANDADPEFSTLREILISRSPHIKRSLANLGHNELANSLDTVVSTFLKQADPDQSTVAGYTSSNFDICPSAISVFNKLGAKVTSDSKDSIIETMISTDEFLGIEKKVIEEESASIDDIEEMVNAMQTAHYFAGETGEILGEDLTDDFAFSTGHLITVMKHYGSDTSVEKQLIPNPTELEVSVIAPDADKWHTHDMEQELEAPEDAGVDTNDVVKGIIIGSNNSILLLKDSRSPFWDLPGGHIQVNESPQEALHREIKEETGLTVTMDTRLFSRDLTIGNPPTEQKRIAFYLVSVIGEIVLSDEHDMNAWIPMDDLKRFNLGSFDAALTDSMKIINRGGLDESKGNEGFAQVTDASESEMDNVHNYAPSDPVSEGEKKTIRTRDGDPRVTELIMNQSPTSGAGYSEAGGKLQREKNPINPTGDDDEDDADNAGRNALATLETPASQAFSSGAVIDLPDDEANEKGVNRDAVGGVGTAGDGSPSATLVNSDVADYTGGGNSRRSPANKGGRLREDYDSNLVAKQGDASVIGTFEGVNVLPADGEVTDRRKKNNSSSKFEYGEEERVDVNQRRASVLPPEQRPLGTGEISIITLDDGKPRMKADEDLEGSVPSPDGKRPRMTINTEEDKPHSPNFDPAVEQFTSLSNDHPFKSISTFIAKSADTPDTIDNFAVLTSDPFAKMDLGKTLVVGGWGSVYVVDREGHKISLNGLRKALKKFLANPEFANVNIFHSGIQVGKLLPSFIDSQGKVWKSHVNNKGMFAVVAFRTDLEVSRRAMSEVMKGNLRGFSLAGNSNPATKEIKCDHGKCWQEINDLEIYELTLCQEPMNQESWITDIIQEPDPLACPECYENPAPPKGYDSNMRPVGAR